MLNMNWGPVRETVTTANRHFMLGVRARFLRVVRRARKGVVYECMNQRGRMRTGTDLWSQKVIFNLCVHRSVLRPYRREGRRKSPAVLFSWTSRTQEALIAVVPEQMPPLFYSSIAAHRACFARLFFVIESST